MKIIDFIVDVLFVKLIVYSLVIASFSVLSIIPSAVLYAVLTFLGFTVDFWLIFLVNISIFVIYFINKGR